MSEPHTADLGTRYRYRQEGAALERERIIKLLIQLESEWRNWLDHYLQQDNPYEVARYRNYILACSDLRDMTQDPSTLFKGEQQ